MFRTALFSSVFASALIFSVGAQAEPQAQAQTKLECNTQGFSEEVIEPAVIEYGELKIDVVKRSGADPEYIQPAVIEVMSRAEYQKLPKMISVRRMITTPAVFEDLPVNLSVGRIANYDILKYPNGAEAHRALERPVPDYDRSITKRVLISQPTSEWVDVTIARPEPVVMPSGDLQVVMTPFYSAYVPWPLVFETVTDKYVKSRTPALIAMSPCTVER